MTSRLSDLVEFSIPVVLCFSTKADALDLLAGWPKNLLAGRSVVIPGRRAVPNLFLCVNSPSQTGEKPLARTQIMLTPTKPACLRHITSRCEYILRLGNSSRNSYQPNLSFSTRWSANHTRDALDKFRCLCRQRMCYCTTAVLCTNWAVRSERAHEITLLLY